jgi:hypothetical protein
VAAQYNRLIPKSVEVEGIYLRSITKCANILEVAE